MRRARMNRQRQKMLVMSVGQEREEVDVLKGSNLRMQQSLFDKDEEIRKLTEQARHVGGDGEAQKLIDNMATEIVRLKEQINILYSRLSMQQNCEEHGYF